MLATVPPSIDQLFREAELARADLVPAAHRRTQLDCAPVEAPVEIETKAILHAIVIDWLRRREKRVPTDQQGVSTAEVCRDLDHEVDFYLSNNTKDPAAHPKTCYTRDDDALETIGFSATKKRSLSGGSAGGSCSQRPATTAIAHEPCIMRSLDARSTFNSWQDGKTYVASGDVFVCQSSGRVHHCTASACKKLEVISGKEGYVCQITGRMYEPGFAHNNDTTTKRFRESKDGAIASQGSAGVSVDTWKPTRTAEQRKAFRLKGKIIKSKNEDTINRFRAHNCESSLYYLTTADLDAQLSGEDLVLARECFSRSKAHSPQSVLTLIEFEMRKRFPNVPAPVLTSDMRDQVNEQCKNMLYTAPAFVRAEIYKKISEEEAHLRASMASYYRERNVSHKRVDPFYVCGRLIESTIAQYERLLAIGLDDPPRPDRALLLYLEEAVVAVWLMLYYTPRARRFHTVQLHNNVVGILYKLQTGVYITDDTGARHVVIPRHEFLDRLPQESDLNRYYQRNDTGASSEASITTVKLIDECFSKLPTDPDTIEAFSLGRYIKLWNEA
jgi:hypothetical protein